MHETLSFSIPCRSFTYALRSELAATDETEYSWRRLCGSWRSRREVVLRPAHMKNKKEKLLPLGFPMSFQLNKATEMRTGNRRQNHTQLKRSGVEGPMLSYVRRLVGGQQWESFFECMGKGLTPLLPLLLCRFSDVPERRGAASLACCLFVASPITVATTPLIQNFGAEQQLH